LRGDSGALEYLPRIDGGVLALGVYSKGNVLWRPRGGGGNRIKVDNGRVSRYEWTDPWDQCAEQAGQSPSRMIAYYQPLSAVFVDYQADTGETISLVGGGDLTSQVTGSLISAVSASGRFPPQLGRR
jgi:hypothetical protein